MTIRTAALILTLSFGFITNPVQASTAVSWDFCKAVGHHAVSIGEARDMGVPQLTALQLAAAAPVPLLARQWSQGMILYAYDKRHIAPATLFSIAMLACMDQMQAGETPAPPPAKKLRR